MDVRGRAGGPVATVKLYANLRELAGGNQLTVRGASVRSVLNELVMQAPKLRTAIVVNGELGGQVVLILNGLNVTDLDVPVGEEDVLAIFPPIAGG